MNQITAIQKLRNMIKYFNQRNETINERFRSIKDMETIYDYEVSNKIWECFGDEQIWHAEQVNRILKYKVYSTNQEVKRGKLSY